MNIFRYTSIYSQHRLLHFAEFSREMAHQHSEENSEKLKKLISEKEQLAEKYAQCKEKYKGLEEPRGIAILLLSGLTTSPVGFQDIQKKAEMFKRDYVEARNINTDDSAQLRASLLQVVEQWREAERELHAIDVKQNRLQVLIDRENPTLQAIVASLEPPTQSKLASLKQKIMKSQESVFEQALKIADLHKEIAVQWYESEGKNKVGAALAVLNDSTKNELRSWAEPQLSSYQLRIRDTAESMELFYVEEMAIRCRENLSLDALKAIADPSVGERKIIIRVLESFATALRQSKKVTEASEIDTVIQKLRS